MISAMYDEDDFDLCLKPVRDSVKTARDLVVVAWSHWRLGDDYIPRLVASELVTNAVVACERANVIKDIRFLCHMVDLRPVIEVWDHVPDPAIVIPMTERSEHGRGLPLVALVCKRWWMEWADDGRKIVGAELAVSA